MARGGAVCQEVRSHRRQYRLEEVVNRDLHQGLLDVAQADQVKRDVLQG
jgi:hypothetical protein